MTDRFLVAIKLKQQRKVYGLRDVRPFDQHTVRILLFLQDVRAEPLRDQGHLQVAGVAVIAGGAKIHDAVRIEGIALALRIQRQGYCARDRHRLCIRIGAVIPFGEDGGMDIFQVV